MIYFLKKQNGMKIPILILDQDGKSLKIQTLEGHVRWMYYNEFIFINFNTLMLV